MVYSREQINKLSPEKKEMFLRLSFGIGENQFLGFDPDKEPILSEKQENYVNHSCESNLWYLVRRTSALRCSNMSQQNARRVTSCLWRIARSRRARSSCTTT